MTEPRNDVTTAGRTLRDYVRVARQHWAVILGVTTAAFALAMALTTQQDTIYRAETRFMIESPEMGDALDLDAEAVRQEHLELLRSEELWRAVADVVPGATSEEVDVEIEYEPDSDVVRLYADAPEATLTAEIARAYLDEYPRLRARTATETYEASASVLQARLDEIQSELTALEALRRSERDGLLTQQQTVIAARRQLAAQQAAFLDDGGDPASFVNAGFEADLAAFDRQLTGIEEDLGEIDAAYDGLTDPKRALRSRLSQELETSALDAELAQRLTLQVIDQASEPESPISPTPMRNGALGIGGGLLLGMAVALLIEYFDDTIESSDELARIAAPLPVLAVVGRYRQADRKVVTASEPHSRPATAYQSLRTSLEFVDGGRNELTVLVTSPTPRAGKSVTATNLAVAFARTGRRVVIIDADLRRPQLHERFGLSEQVGLSSLLTGELVDASSNAVIEVEEHPGVYLLPAGPPAADPSTVLSRPEARTIFEQARSWADVVVVDCPPVLVAPDAAILASYCDAVVLVVRSGGTTVGQLRGTLDSLEQSHAPVTGTVLNAAPAGALLYRGRYDYYLRDSKPRRFRRRPTSAAEAADPAPNGHVRGADPGTDESSPAPEEVTA